jgi:diacylglycerol kinase family enzyme
VLLVINPSASGVTPRNRVVIQNAIASEHDLEVAETNRRGHATRHAQGAAARGVDVVIAVGGDGTVNEVTNGLAQSDTALGVLPGGSTNVFARQLGFVNDPEAATEQLLHGLRTDTIRKVGLGIVNGRYFCFHVGMGFDAAVVERVERFGSLKRWFGHPLFAAAAVATWVKGYDRKHPAFRVEQPEKPGVDGFFAIALNVDPYTFVGAKPLSMAPLATLDSPLSLVTLTSLRGDRVLRAASLSIRRGDVTKVDSVMRSDGLLNFTVRGHRPFPWQVDGDFLGDTDLLEFNYEPEALHLVMPPRAN